MMADNKLQDMIRTSLESIRAMVDANTVVGTPINTPSGTTIIPISKVSVGYASGGLDFGSKPNTAKNFGGGGGTGLSVQPVCFLAVNAEGQVEVLTMAKDGPADPVERVADLVEKTPDIIARIRNIFKKNKKADGDAVEEVVEAAAEAVEDLKASEEEA